MGGQPIRNPTERDLRSLDLKEFLALVEADIHELDERHRARQRLLQAESPLPPLESLPLFPVSCCGKRLGAFPRSARVRCPFCGRWLAAAEAPEQP